MTQRIYTKTGDTGETGLFGGGRVPKSHPRVAAYGAVDELNAVLGWARSVALTDFVRDALQQVQHDLFAIGAHLATAVSERRTSPRLPPLPQDRIPVLESWIDTAEAELPELRSFILPGGSAGGATLHVARTVCRRAERCVVELARTESVTDVILIYLNRLSDLLFVLARLENHRAGISDELWTSRSEP